MGRGSPLRIGILGAARIAPTAVVRPARDVASVSIEAVAARDPQRARGFARKHGIERVHPDYAALLEDPTLDAVYIALPNSLHCEWTIRALRAGKHVLCEKPLAANAEEAERMAEAAEATGLVLAEGLAYRYHPLASRMRALVESGSLGKIVHIDAEFCVPLLRLRDIRFRFDLAGGATMDLGSSMVNLVRYLAADEPSVVSARARLRSPGVDRHMEAELAFADGRTARIVCSICSRTLPRTRLRVRGEIEEMLVTNPTAPHLFHRLRLRSQTGTLTESVVGGPTHMHQLAAFVRAVRERQPMATDARDGVANMRVVDAIYEAAGLPRRGV